MDPPTPVGQGRAYRLHPVMCFTYPTKTRTKLIQGRCIKGWCESDCSGATWLIVCCGCLGVLLLRYTLKLKQPMLSFSQCVHE